VCRDSGQDLRRKVPVPEAFSTETASDEISDRISLALSQKDHIQHQPDSSANVMIAFV
jgi:hypothetical protein